MVVNPSTRGFTHLSNQPTSPPSKLARAQCRLSSAGWGLLNLKGGVVTAGKEWTDDGSVYEIHSLKR